MRDSQDVRRAAEPPGKDHPYMRLAFELPGRLEVAWAMAGGIVAGGPLVASIMLSGRASSSMLMTITSVLFVIGGALGLVHGAVLGYLGREQDCSGHRAVQSLVMGVFVAVPALLLAWFIALWIGLTAAALSLRWYALLAIVAVGWVTGGVICFWGAWQGWRALGNMLERWPEHRAGIVILAVVFVFLLVSFLVWQPEVWWTELRVTGVGAVLLAVGVTVWVAAPATAFMLWLTHRHAPLHGSASHG
jgi:hypothetical protein